MREVKGFTLVEMLVVIAILSLVGTLILNIFTRTLQGGNKAQLIQLIKQNGQSVLEVMDKTIRDSDYIICNTTSTDPTIGNATLVVIKNGVYTRFRYTGPQPDNNPPANGFIEWESFNLPSSPPAGTDPDFYVRDFDRTACNLLSDNPINLTDTNVQKGVSVDCIADANGPNCEVYPIFKEEIPQAGYKKILKISFALKPGVRAPAAIAGQIDPVNFQTTVQLR